MSRNARTSAPRRLALSFGTAAGAALIAASFSMGTAPVAGADVLGADTVSDVIGALGAQAVSAADVPDTMAVSYVIDALDVDAFSLTGSPTDLFGILGYGLDNYLLGPAGLEPFLTPLAVELVDIITGVPSGAESVDVTPVSDLIGALDPSAFAAGAADLTAPTAVSLVDPVIDGLLNSGLSLF